MESDVLEDTTAQRFDTFDQYILEIESITSEANKAKEALDAEMNQYSKEWIYSRTQRDVKQSWLEECDTRYLKAKQEYTESCDTWDKQLTENLTKLRNDLVIHLQSVYTDPEEENSKKVLSIFDDFKEFCLHFISEIEKNRKRGRKDLATIDKEKRLVRSYKNKLDEALIRIKEIDVKSE